MTMKDHFPLPPEYVFHEFLLKSHEKQSKFKAERRDFVRSRNWSTL